MLLIKTSIMLIMACGLYAQSCASPSVQNVTIATSGAATVLLIPAVSGQNIHVCTVSIPLTKVVATQLQQTNGSSNTPTGPLWNSAGPYASLNGSVASGVGNGLSLAISQINLASAAVSGGGIITYYLSTT